MTLMLSINCYILIFLTFLYFLSVAKPSNQTYLWAGSWSFSNPKMCIWSLAIICKIWNKERLGINYNNPDIFQCKWIVVQQEEPTCLNQHRGFHQNCGFSEVGDSSIYLVWWSPQSWHQMHCTKLKSTWKDKWKLTGRNNLFSHVTRYLISRNVFPPGNVRTMSFFL